MRPGQPLPAVQGFSTVPKGRAASTWQAAADVVAVQTRLARAGLGMAQAAMAGATRCETGQGKRRQR